MTKRLVDTWGHKPACNTAGNPPGCTCEEEAQVIMAQHVKKISDLIDKECVKRIYARLGQIVEVPLPPDPVPVRIFDAYVKVLPGK